MLERGNEDSDLLIRADNGFPDLCAAHYALKSTKSFTHPSGGGTIPFRVDSSLVWIKS